MRRISLILLWFISFTVTATAVAGNYYYLVKQNDAATTLLNDADLLPVYGKKGTLAKLARVNAKKTPDINRLAPGKKLLFPVDFVMQGIASQTIKIIRDDQIDFLRKLSKIPSPEVKISEWHYPNSQTVSEWKSPKSNRKIAAEEPADLPKGSDAAIPRAEAAPVSRRTRLPQSRLIFTMGSGYSRLDSTTASNGAGATILSKARILGGFTWEQAWAEEFRTFLKIGLSTYESGESNGGSVAGGTRAPASLSFGAVRYFGRNTNLSLEIGARDEIFAPSYSAGIATLETKPVNYMKAVVERDLYEVEQLKFTAGLGASYMFATSGGNYDVGSGTEFLGRLKVSHELKAFTLFGTGELSRLSQTTTTTTQTRTDIDLKIGIVIPLGGEAP